MTERLIWQQTRALKKEFQLLKGSEPLAHLRFPSMWSSRAKGTIGNLQLAFIWEGVIHPRLRVSNEVLDQAVAVARLANSLRREAEIELPSGLRYELTSKGTFHKVWKLSESDASGRKELFTLVETRSLLKESGFIEFSDIPRENNSTILLLALLVCYLVVRIHEREAAT
jgi:hypothetical protein